MHRDRSGATVGPWRASTKDTPPDEVVGHGGGQHVAEGAGERRSAAEAERLRDQDEAQRAAESGQD